jgi:hypothetical protein
VQEPDLLSDLALNDLLISSSFAEVDATAVIMTLPLCIEARIVLASL